MNDKSNVVPQPIKSMLYVTKDLMPHIEDCFIYVNILLTPFNLSNQYILKKLILSSYISLCLANDDEVRRVCMTPGDPCGCTRQYYQRSGLTLPSPWFRQWSVSSSWLCCPLIISTFSCLSLTDLSNISGVHLQSR